MQATASSSPSFMPPELDLNPPASWSQPANALGLSNPLAHQSLPQSQQVQRLQQQIEQHRQLQRSTLQSPNNISHKSVRRPSSSGSGFSLSTSSTAREAGDMITIMTDQNVNTAEPNHDNVENCFNSMAEYRKNTTNPHHAQSTWFGSDAGFETREVQHINIQNDLDEEDSEMSADENEESEWQSSSRGSSVSNDSRGMYINNHRHSQQQQHHHPRSLSHGFGGFQGFTPIISPESPHPPIMPSSSPGSSVSDGNSFGSAVFTPPGGMMQRHSYHQQNQSSQPPHLHQLQHSSNFGGVESSLASLAALSVMATSLSNQQQHHPGPTKRLSSGSSSSSTGIIGLSFQTQQQASSQGLPAIFQNQVSVFTPGSQNAFTSALGQQLQMQRQQQGEQQRHEIQQQQQQQQQLSAQSIVSQKESMATSSLSSSLPVYTAPYYHHHHHAGQQQQEQKEHIQQCEPLQSSSTSTRNHTVRSKSLSMILPPRHRSIPSRPPEAPAPRRYLGRQNRKTTNGGNTDRESLIFDKDDIVKDVTTPSRRMAHIVSEQKRREKINGGFDELKSVIPECAQNTDSKATILRKAVDRILELEEELRRYIEIYHPDSNRQGRGADRFGSQSLDQDDDD